MLGMRQMAVLVAVADTRSLAAAARELQWSQPTVAHHIRSMERELKVPIISTSPAGTELTLFGKRLLPHARAILARSEAAEREVLDILNTRREMVSVGSFPSAGAMLLPAVVGALRASGFGVATKEGEIDELIKAMWSLELDAAVLYFHDEEPPILPAGAEIAPLYAEELLVMVPAVHPQSNVESAHLEAFSDDSWILGSSPLDRTDRALTHAAAKAGFTPRIAMRSDDYAVVTGYVRSGLGVAVIPEFSVRKNDGTAFVRIDREPIVRHVVLATLNHVNPDVTDALQQALRVQATAILQGQR